MDDVFVKCYFKSFYLEFGNKHLLKRLLQNLIFLWRFHDIDLIDTPITGFCNYCFGIFLLSAILLKIIMISLWGLMSFYGMSSAGCHSVECRSAQYWSGEITFLIFFCVNYYFVKRRRWKGKSSGNFVKN